MRPRDEDDAIIVGGLMWVVVFLLICAAMWWAVTAPTAHALPISYSFNGILADGGTITGAFAFDNDAAAIATNVRNLSPNQSWGLLSSSFTIAPIYKGLPSWQAPVGEFCTGQCIFSGPTDVTTLTISNANASLRLGWDGTFSAFRLNSSDLRTVTPTGTSLIMVTSGTLTQHSVPLPDTFWNLLIGLGGLFTYLRWR
jgi:hypothetical protein